MSDHRGNALSATSGSPSLSAPSSDLPHEIYDYIIDFLWDDVAALAQCCLVSRTLRPSAEYHLNDYKSDTLSISTKKVLVAYGRAFRARGNGSFRQRVPFAKVIRIVDTIHKPFAHLFPMLMVGCDVPWANTLDLFQLDWTTTCPHFYFFDHLGCYTMIKTLRLMSCRFRTTSQLQRLINALPNLETVSLKAIHGSIVSNTLESSQSSPSSPHGSEPKFNRSLRSIHLGIISGDSDRWSASDNALRVAMQSILAVCSLYRTTTQLLLPINTFDSLSSLVHFLRSFPRLHTLVLSPRYHTNVFWRATADVEALPPACLRLYTLRLYELPAPPTIDLLKLISMPRMSDTIEEIDIQAGDSLEPTVDLMEAVTSALSRSGSALMALTVVWTCHPGSPQLLLTANTTLEKLAVVYRRVPGNIRIIEDTLLSLISSITSPDLIGINITMAIADEEYDREGEGIELEHARDLTVFHDFLDKSFSLNQDMVSTVFKVPTSKSTHAAVLRFKALLLSRLSDLFAPWVKQGILYFRLDMMSRTGDDPWDAGPAEYIVDDSEFPLGDG